MMKMNGEILGLGSLIMDISIQCDRLPKPGETVYTLASYNVNPGGKGGNQAVAAARSGGRVRLIGRITEDDYGKKLLCAYEKENIVTESLIRDDSSSTGVCFVWVDSTGTNECLCSLGVNAKVTPEDIMAFEPYFEEGTIVMTTLEYEPEILELVTKTAKEKGCFVVVDPSSKDYSKLTEDIAKRIDVLKPNEVETEILTGVRVETLEDAKRAVAILRERGISIPIVSLGERGAVYGYEGEIYEVEGIKVKAVDTTAAGDTFIGSLCAKLSKGEDIHSAVSYANRAAAYCVTRPGAQSSIPFEKSVL